MIREIAAALGFTLSLLSAALVLSISATAQNEPLVCYYDANGNQHDADSCKSAFDLSDKQGIFLHVRCLRNAGAVCLVGNSGLCRPGSHKYRHYQVFVGSTDGCPARYSQFGTGAQPPSVAPSCPAGYVFSGGQCIRDATPAPTCPAGYVFSGGQCVRDTVATPAPVPAPTPTASSDQFDLRHGFDLPGGDYIQLRGLTSYQDCQDICSQDDRCSGYTFNTRFARCFLKWRGQNWTAYQNAVSGLRIRNNPVPASGASQCDIGCTGAYDNCLENASRQSAADRSSYEWCATQRESCRSNCVSQGHCITSDGGQLCP